MSGVDKAEAHKQAWIRAEAAKLASQLQAKQIADLVDPGSSDIVRGWIKEEVDRYMHTLEETLHKLIDTAVDKYCKTVFDSHTDDEHFMLIARGSRRASVDSMLGAADFVELGTRPSSRSNAPITNQVPEL